MNKEDWKTLENRCYFPHSQAHLLVDGYRLTIQVERYSKTLLQFCLAVYVNGKIDYQQAKQDCEERRRFWRKTTRRLHSARDIDKIFKGSPKKYRAQTIKSLGLDKTFDHYIPYFMSFSSLKSHLVKHNTSIELSQEPTQ
jgi:hypothetical protein